MDKLNNNLKVSQHNALLQSPLKYFIKSFHSIYGNLLKDIKMIIKTIKIY